MNNFQHQLYILTEHDEIYLQSIERLQLDNLQITEDKAQATILLAAPPMAAPCIDEFPKLEWLQSVYAGVDALVIDPKRTDYELTNIKGIFGQLISEYVIGYIINHYRHFPLYRQQQEAAQWTPHLYESIIGKEMVILGTGSIGGYLSQVAASMGLKIIGVNSTGIPPKEGQFSQIYHRSEIASALTNADIVVNTLPNTDDTQGLLNIETLSHCQNAILFNVGRGKTLVEPDLIDAIAQGHIQHAYLDVFDKEPLDPEHPFWHHHAITVTPHIAALSFPSQVVEQFVHNYTLWNDGFQLSNAIDFDKGY